MKPANTDAETPSASKATEDAKCSGATDILAKALEAVINKPDEDRPKGKEA